MLGVIRLLFLINHNYVVKFSVRILLMLLLLRHVKLSMTKKLLTLSAMKKNIETMIILNVLISFNLRIVLARRKPHETQWYIFILYFLFYNDAAQIRKCFELQSFICRNCASVATVLIRICSFVTSLFLDFLRCPWQVQALLLLLGECDIPSTVPSSAFAQPQNIMVLLYTILLSFKRIFLSIWISLSTFSVFHLSEWWQCLQWLKAFTKNCFSGEVSWKTKRKKLWKKNSV